MGVHVHVVYFRPENYSMDLLNLEFNVRTWIYFTRNIGPSGVTLLGQIYHLYLHKTEKYMKIDEIYA